MKPEQKPDSVTPQTAEQDKSAPRAKLEGTSEDTIQSSEKVSGKAGTDRVAGRSGRAGGRSGQAGG